MALYLGRGCRTRSLSVVILLGVSLVVCLFYVLTSRMNHFLEFDSLQQRFEANVESEQRVHVVGRDSGGVPGLQGGDGRQIPMAVDVEDRDRLERSPDSLKTYTSSE